MRSSSINFIAWVLVLTVLCVAAEYALPLKFRLNSAFIMLGIFAVTVTAVHMFLVYSAKGEGKAFVGKFMVATILKFFFYLTVLIGFLLYSHEDRKALALHFLVYYALFTIVEVNRLFKELK